MNQSESIVDLAAALIAARPNFAPAIKNSFNPSFKSTANPNGSKYTDLASAIDATQAALLAQGIVVLQSPSGSIEHRSVSITTRLLHKSGQFLEGTLDVPALGRNGYDAQSVGSAITYGRRYALMAMLGIAPEDDDGNAASGPEPQKEIQRKSEKAQIGIASNGDPIFDENGEPVVERQAAPPVTKKNGPQKVTASSSPGVGVPRGKRFFAIAMSNGHTKEEINDYLGSIGVERSEEIPVSAYEEACDWAAGA